MEARRGAAWAKAYPAHPCIVPPNIADVMRLVWGKDPWMLGMIHLQLSSYTNHLHQSSPAYSSLCTLKLSFKHEVILCHRSNASRRRPACTPSPPPPAHYNIPINTPTHTTLLIDLQAAAAAS